jgi:hypothetical protein
MTTVLALNNALADPELMTDICGEIAAGGTLVEFCRGREISYRAINRWINDDPERAKRYKLALSIREDHAKDLIISELIAYINADITKCFDENGNLKVMTELAPNERRLVAGLKFRELFEMEGERGAKKRVHVGNIIELKFWDKPRSIETFMRHLSMLVERKDINVKHSLADLIAGDAAKPETTP